MSYVDPDTGMEFMSEDEYERIRRDWHGSHDCNDYMAEIPGFGWDCAKCWGHVPIRMRPTWEEER